MNRLIYVADDDRYIRELVCEYLIKEGHLTACFDDGSSLYDAFLIKKPDMVIIDIMMPGTDGLTICKKIRNESELPIIIISAKDEDVDRILGLELGGDDYLAKPFSPRELILRVKNIFGRIDRRLSSKYPNVVCLGDLTIDLDKRQVRKDDTEIDLTVKEMELMIEFAMNKDRVFTRDQLIKKIWGYEFIGETRAIDDLVKRLRKKFKEAGANAGIETVWGYGYKATGREAL